MNFKLFGAIILSMVVILGCQENGAEEEQSTQQEEQMQENGQAQQEQSPFQQQQPQQATDVTDEELQEFADVAQQSQAVNQQAQQEMIGVLQEEGIDVDRFNEIQQAEQNPQQQSNATEEEMKKYQSAIQAMSEIQVEAQKEMQEIIEGSDISQERFQEIGMALRSDPELQQKFRALQQGS